MAAHRMDRECQLFKRYLHRPAEELNDTSADPYELKNLAANPEHAA